MAKSKKSGWTLFALGLGYFIDQGEIATIGVLQDAMMRFWNATRTLPIGRTEIGMMETLRTILMTFSAPLWGYAADRFSRKNVLIFGTGVWGSDVHVIAVPCIDGEEPGRFSRQVDDLEIWDGMP